MADISGTEQARGAAAVVVYAFAWAPPFARGLVRDLRVRWALEEAGIAYTSRLIGGDEKASAAYRALQPFGQVPVLVEDGRALFESGAIALHVAERSEALLPADPLRRAVARGWVFAAIDTIEGAIAPLADIDLFHAGEDWARARRPAAEAGVRPVAELAAHLGNRPFLDGSFTVGDLVMTSVLRQLRHTALVAEHPALAAYQARCEDRPAFRRAFDAQLADFAAAEAPGPMATT